ncbi:hypothetical protein EJ08DRAFT_679099 [Tothia fuscella]|uniref:Uncharacterized protein n=1 Tax=Tothia fuscella TaxID=1048955 RepID=A0A9P4NR46_9PEZI|nr:hypothetical protein EJ08DRAFT_679099 [Tothia fuscella]
MPITFRPEDEKLTTAYSFLLSTNNLPTPSQSLSTFITHTHDLVAEQWQVPPKRQTKFIRAQGLSAIAASGLPIEAVTPPNPSHSHLFEVVWPIPTNESYERVTSAEEKALCKRLGFQHVSLAIVQLKSVTTPVVVRAEPHEATVSQKGKSQAATTATPPAPAPPPTKTLTYSGKIFHLVYVDDSPEARLNPSNYRDVLWTPHDITKYNIVNHWVGISNTSGLC